MTENQKERLRQLENYANKQRSKLGYGLYPPIAENKEAIDTCTNVLTYCILIDEDF